MKKKLLAFAFVAFLAFPSHAQSQKSAFWAGTLEAALPLAGHAYAGDAKAGLIPASVFVGGLGMYVVGAYLWTDDFADALSCIIPSDSCWDDRSSSGGDVLVILGTATMFGAKAWGVWSAANVAKGFDVSLRPLGGRGVALSARFRSPW